jgi:hypothetical protein
MSHVFLLCFVAQTTPGGTLKDMDVEDIAQVAQWRGDPDEFVGTLVELNLLDNRGDTYSIHNWQKHNYFCMTADARSRIARENANKRWRKKRKVNQEDNAIGNADSNAPPPSPPPPPSLEGREGVEDSALEEQSSPPPIEVQLVELASEIYRPPAHIRPEEGQPYIDTTMERGWLIRYNSISPENQAKVQELAAINGVKLPDPSLYED